MQRRHVLKLGLVTTLASAANALARPSAAPVIDAHIHLFDPRRPGGIPWPDKSDAIYRPALPEGYAAVSQPFGIAGAIAVEASPLAADNDWILNLIAGASNILGYIGNLAPGTPAFARELDRLRANPLFLGIRCGNLWNRDLFTSAEDPAFLADLRRLAAAGLTMDSANPDLRLIRALLHISGQIPDLRIVLDHLPNAALPESTSEIHELQAGLKTLSTNPNVFVKLSEIPVRINGEVPTQVSYYRRKLDAIWDLFGEDHILFGSDWPNSDHLTTYATTFGIVRGYINERAPSASEKFFARNSLAAYRWHARTPAQALIQF